MRSGQLVRRQKESVNCMYQPLLFLFRWLDDSPRVTSYKCHSERIFFPATCCSYTCIVNMEPTIHWEIGVMGKFSRN